MSKISFYAITEAQYDAIVTKDANALYFITDTNEIYKGESRYSHPAKVVSSYPSSGQQVGTIYVNSTTNDAKIWDGTNWYTFYSLPIENSSANFSTSSANESRVPSVAALVSYVSGITQGSSDAIKTIARKSGTGNEHLLTLTTVGNSSSDANLLSGFITGITFVDGSVAADAGHYGLKVTTSGSSGATYIDLEKENFLTSASYNSSTHILTLTLNVDSDNDGNNDVVTVNLEDLIDTYTAKAIAANDTVAVTISNNEISAAVRISATTGNKISVNSDGLFVGEDSIGTGKENHVIIADSDGTIKDSGKTITTASTINGDTASANVIPTEEAVVDYVESSLTWITSVS